MSCRVGLELEDSLRDAGLRPRDRAFAVSVRFRSRGPASWTNGKLMPVHASGGLFSECSTSPLGGRITSRRRSRLRHRRSRCAGANDQRESRFGVRDGAGRSCAHGAGTEEEGDDSRPGSQPAKREVAAGFAVGVSISSKMARPHRRAGIGERRARRRPRTALPSAGHARRGARQEKLRVVPAISVAHQQLNAASATTADTAHSVRRATITASSGTCRGPGQRLLSSNELMPRIWPRTPSG